ncbi:type I polyketide synthase, partial [Streptomyces sp. NPDC047072]|uniref:type I polyketide synthase n=1 Tax=Streptomyces sp. NPDC047072 TaxID=3154809 RepID=UPI0033E50B7E
NGPSQERVIRAALADAGLGTGDVDVVEAHGTGTRLGDPIEAQALLNTYGQDRDTPLYLGSLKSNIGHSSAAAGIGGVIKAVLALGHGVMPRTLHAEEPTPMVDWDSGTVQLLTETTPWPDLDRPRRAAVSSFGASGTNAHVVLEHHHDAMTTAAPKHFDGPVAWLLSGATEAGLRGQVDRIREFAAGRRPEEVARALLGRAQLRHRRCAVGRTTEELLSGLDRSDTGATGVAASRARPVFVFPGQGWQWTGMGRRLLDEQPVFAAAVSEVDTLVQELADWSPLAVLRGDTPAERVDVVQPVMFAVLVGLARLWEDAGVRPAAVVGHSQGEIAAAHVAGILSLKDAVRVVVGRSRALVALAGAGGMASVAADAERVGAWARPYDGVEVAAINGPRATVVSGPVAALTAFLDACRERGVRTRTIDVDYASHGPAVEAVRERILAELEGIDPRTARVPMHSTTTGLELDGPQLGPEYWYENLRRPVAFGPVVEGLLDRPMFIEVSAHPVLVPSLEQIAEEAGVTPHVQPTLTRDADGTEGWLEALGRAWTAGAGVNWTGTLGEAAGAAELPVYDFDHARYWAPDTGPAADAGKLGVEDLGHPLLGSAVTVAGDDGDVVLSGRLTPTGWLADHRVASTVVVPGTAFVEMALRAGRLVSAGRVEELVVVEPLALVSAVDVQVVVDTEHRFTVYARPADSRAFTVHAVGTLGPEDPPPATFDWGTAWPPPTASPVDLGGFYEELADRGYGYGPVFQGLRAAWRGPDGTVFGEVELPDGAGEVDRFGVHPALLDSAAHLTAVGGLLPADGLWLPYSWQGVRLYATGSRRARVRIAAEGEGTLRVELADESGTPLARVAQLRARPSRARSARVGGVHRVDRTPLGDAPEFRGRVAVIGDLEVTGAVPCKGLVDVPAGTAWVLVDLRGPDTDVDTEPEASAAHQVAEAGLRLFQELAGIHAADWGVTVVTRAGDLAASVLHGMTRTARNELPLPVTLLETDAGPVDWRRILGHVAREPQLFWHGGQLLAPRVRDAEQGIGDVQGFTTDDSWHLAAGGTGSFDDIAPVVAPHRPLPPGHVRLHQRAAGLNFHDVVVALNMVPGDDAFGGEGAGEVVETGPGVAGLRVGDRVFGVMPDAFAPVTVADARTVVRMPQEWTWQQAAAVPAAHITAYYALVDLAGLRPGERILIHAATGGVGMAALHLARHLGAEVYATASAAKWPVLEAMGIPPERIADSRTTEYAETFAGHDIDVSLGSLAGAQVDATLSLLGVGGRHLEMGKTDVRDPAEVARLHPGVTYRAFDAAEAGPDRTHDILTEVVALFAAGHLHHPPVTAWPLPRARQALRHLARGGHVGKNVLTVAPPLDPDGTVLITGGTGTLGALAARHLAAPGRRLLLLSRQGLRAPGAPELREELTALGAHVTITACDTTDRARLAAALTGHRLTAVIHTAGVLRDATLPNQTPQTLHEVLAAKVDTAVHLHHLTRDTPLAAFVLYSSAAGLLGNPGQANYTAASTYLDALAAHRAAHGLPATSIAWGLWTEATAMTAGRTQADQARMAASPLAALTPQEGLRMLDAAVAGTSAHCLAAPRNPAHVPVDPLWGTPRVERPAGPAMVRGRTTAQLLAAVQHHTAAVLGSTPRQIDPHRGFLDSGIDSLTAVELRNHLNQATGLRLTTTTIFDHPTPHALAQYLHAQLGPQDKHAEPDLRDLFAAIPVERLRGAGILEPLLRLAGAADDNAADVERGRTESEQSAEIDEMSLTDLVRLARGDD